MAETPAILSSVAGAVIVADKITPEAMISLSGANVVLNFPTPFVSTSLAGALVTTNYLTREIGVSLAGAYVVVKDRVYNPRLRAWGYTLDGHDNFVLRLGDNKTLIFDLSTESWSWWTSGEYNFWRANTGISASAGEAYTALGSPVIVGDDTYGHLWVLDPEQPYDDSAADPADGAPVRFQREATGQVTTRQRRALPVYEVYLTGDFGNPFQDGDTVTLEYSDNLGNNFVSAGAIATQDGNYKQQFSWRSLGQITQAGRIFKIKDDGAFARIESLDCSIGGLQE